MHAHALCSVTVKRNRACMHVCMQPPTFEGGFGGHGGLRLRAIAAAGAAFSNA